MTFLEGNSNGRWHAEDKEVDDHNIMEGRRVLKYIQIPTTDSAQWCAKCCGYTVYGLGCAICSPRSDEDHLRYRGMYEPDLKYLLK